MRNVRKMFAVLDASQRRRAAWLLVLISIGMVLETAGVGLVIPFLALITESDIGAKYPGTQPVLEWLGNPDRTTLIVIGMFVMLGFFLFKNLFLAFMAWQRTHFVASTQATLSQRLFTTYLRQPYAFHLRHNSAELIRNVSMESNQFTLGLNSLIQLVTQALVVLGVGGLLLAVEPIGGLVTFVLFGVAGGAFQALTKKRVRWWGKARRFHQGKVIQHLQQGLGGAKDVKLLGREEVFLSQFATHAVGVAQSERKRKFISALPKLWFEALAILGLVVLVLTLLAQGRPIEAILPTLAVFAAAAFRLMPRIGLLTASSQELRFVGPVVEHVYRELKELEGVPPVEEASPMVFRRDIRLRGVAFAYPGTAWPAVSQIDLEIPRGSSAGLVGGSGAGKSTLVDLILGLLEPSQGQVLVDGVDIRTNLRGWQDQVGYVPQSIYLTDESLRRNIAFGLHPEEIDDEAVRVAAKAAKLEELIAGLPKGLETTVGERGVRLSGGQRQRIGIARALYHDPAVLVLDEATSALDTKTEEGVMEAVNALQGTKTIIVVAHRLTTVARCDKLYRIEQGRLVSEGAFDEVVYA